MKKDLVLSIFRLNYINNYEVVTNENKTKDIVINYIMGNKDILPYSRTNMFRVEKQVKTQLEALKNMFLFDITHFGIGSFCGIAVALVCFIFTVASSGILAGLSLAALLSLTGFSVKQFKKMKKQQERMSLLVFIKNKIFGQAQGTGFIIVIKGTLLKSVTNIAIFISVPFILLLYPYQ